MDKLLNALMTAINNKDEPAQLAAEDNIMRESRANRLAAFQALTLANEILADMENNVVEAFKATFPYANSQEDTDAMNAWRPARIARDEAQLAYNAAVHKTRCAKRAISKIYSAAA